ncbi:MFS transporter [Sporosarcina sp. P21c]|uniref:MFS transporter n=1 Tax=Sporosarcina TaxID=1569 RepID=UPI000A14CFAF|nr:MULTISPECIES: MFS transporter [Sporosarcina]ARJ38566.1 multidrug MFS transporter [Sporosarcina ureae]PIC67391.1 MFS transporter [Sporosarcina sp. P16a]PIC89647.1 MFS transporter [Sporosarcina sp. P21c]PIC92842.1 MFS transporter [Sporosarcina sp. P25]
MKKETITLGLLLTNLLIAFLGIGLVIPVMPRLMNELHISGTVVGYMVATFAMAQLLVSPFSGRWVDTFGRKKMIVVGLIIFSSSEFLFGIGQTLPVLFASRILGGISAAFIMPAVTAFIADITTMETRSKALGFMSAAISTGFILGPGVGGFLATYGTRVPFFFAGGLALFAAIFSFIALREPERYREAVAEDATKPGLKRIFARHYFIVFIIILILSFGLASFESIFSLFVDHKFGFTPKDIAIIITGGGLVGAVAQVVLFDKLARTIGEKRLIFFCLVFSSILVFLTTFVQSYVSVLAVTMIIFVGFDLIRPAATSYLSKIAGNEQGFVGGMNSMFTSIGNVFGPIIGGALFDVDVDYPFYFGAFVLLLGVVLNYIWIKRTPSFRPNI